MSDLIPPHGGGKIQSLLIGNVAQKDMMRKAISLKKVSVSSCEKSDILMFSMGAYTPLRGFMTEAD